jgi:hypothetical protein
MGATRRALVTVVGRAALGWAMVGRAMVGRAAVGFAAAPDGNMTADGSMTAHRRRLSGLLSEPASARLVAAAYMAAIGDSFGEANLHRAAMDLEMPAVLAPMHRIAGAAASRAWLGIRIRADFEEGAVVDVDGWRLSRTEVGVCLLVAGAA